MKKKEPFERTKVVIRHLPPSLSQIHLFSQFDHLFSHRYDWFCFCPGKSSKKHQRYSLAYVNFKSPGDVLEFAEFFHGHIFVNEKGARFKATVEYAPSQRVPKPSTVKNSREGSIYEVENPPSSETHLERKEAEPSAAKEMPITTPLMEFVRQKRAAKGGNQGSSAAIKGSKRAGSASLNEHGSCATKRGAQKKKGSTKKSNQNSKSAILVAPRREDQLATLSGKEISEIASVSSVEGCDLKITLTSDYGKKKILLLKGKDREISDVSVGLSQQHGNSPVSTAPKQKQRFKSSERLTKSILLNNEAHETQSSTAIKPQHKSQNSNSDGKFKDRHSLGYSSEKKEKITRRNKDRPDHGFQNPSCHSDVPHDNKEQLTYTVLQNTGFHSGFIKGSNRHLRHHAAPHRMKGDCFMTSEQKSSKKRGASGYAVHEKQMWVQKSSAGS
ncbi:regulator of nonsense transcripts UPF3 isoform X2 [Hevea brasiliensis]|uniref:regulator of nonsense transcripts UPF3 isoform X2 n=1 Tax=Hevea brasiliensis TaxID=3981 RepID=UPI0025E1D9DC|nr:regulator of nonsense transcripts UPF3 isoform X2 [Hevea brasiliensis]